MTYANNLNVNANYNKSLGKYGNLGLSANASYNKGTEPDYNASLRYSKQFGNGLGININADSPLKNIRDNGRVNLGFTYNFQDGGVYAELTDDEIEEYRKGGYIVEDISVPELTQAQKGKFVAPPLPIDRTKSETTKMFQPIVNNAIRDKNAIIARQNEERKRNIDRGVKAVKNSISAIEKNKTYTKKQKAELLKKETDKLFNIDQTQLEETGAVLNQTDQHSIKAAPEKTVGDYAERTWDIITNPFDAAKYSISGGGIENMPWNYNKMKELGIDPSARSYQERFSGSDQKSNMVGDALNSFNLFDAGDKVYRNASKGNWADAALEASRFLEVGAFMKPNVLKKIASVIPNGNKKNTPLFVNIPDHIDDVAEEVATQTDNVSDLNTTVNTTPNRYRAQNINSGSIDFSHALEDDIMHWVEQNNLDRGNNALSQHILSEIEPILESFDIRGNQQFAQLNDLSPNDAELLRNKVYNTLNNINPEVFEQYRKPSFQAGIDDSNVVNRSGFTKKSLLLNNNYSDEVKKTITDLPEEEFKNTILKPNGEIVPYNNEEYVSSKFVYDPNFDAINKIRHADAIPISTESYADIFNQNIDYLNDIIIPKYNKSGAKYRVTGIDKHGNLRFSNPKQTVKSANYDKYFTKLTDAEKKLEEINNLFKSGQVTNEQEITEALKAQANYERKIRSYTRALQDEIPEGTSSFVVDIVPGHWRGEIEDLANSDYYKYLPGLNMAGSTNGVFADRIARRGTGTYEALNEYLKKFDLGRVKPGFNSQTESSHGAWKNFINKDKAHGFYGKQGVLYGALKKQGGYIDVELSDDEIKDHIKKGYVVEDITHMQSGGQLPYQVWQEKTGTPWSEAHKQGLTNGTAEQNIALMNKLLSGEVPTVSKSQAVPVQSRPVQTTPNFASYDNNVKQMVSNGATLDDLVRIRMGTREGLMHRFPDLFSASNAKSKVVNKVNIPQNKQTVATKVEQIVNKPDTTTIPKSVLPKLSAISETTFTRIPAPKITVPKADTPIVKKFEKSKLKAQDKLKQKEVEDSINRIKESLTPGYIKKPDTLRPTFTPVMGEKKPVIPVKKPIVKIDTPFVPKPFDIKGQPIIKQDTPVAIKNFQDIKGDPSKNKISRLDLPHVKEEKPVSIKKTEKIVPKKEESKVVVEDADYKVINNLNQRLNKFDESLQGLYYDYTNPHHSAEKRKQATETFRKKIQERNNLINTINAKKRDYAGGMDSWIDNSAPDWVKKPAQKYDLSDQVEATSYKLPKLETFKEKEERDNEKFRTTKRVDDLGTKNGRWSFRVSASNDDPMKVQLYGTRGERKSNMNIKAKGAVMHFLDQSPLTGYMHPITKNYYRDLKQDAYVGVLEKQKDGSYGVKYVPKKEIPAKDLTKNTFLVRQEKFDNIDFDKKVEDDNFAGHTYWTKKGTTRATIPVSSGKDANNYDYSSGQSVVFIFPYKNKTRYVHFAGSPNDIRKEGEELKKQYKLKSNTLTLGVADAGSYSSSIKGDISDSKLKDWNKGYANRNSFTGAGMALVD
jgi:hypothetical protein